MFLFLETLSTDPRFFFATILVMVVSICLHELAHGVVAVWLGDDTPIVQERITLNPMVHMGPMSLVLLFVAGISWGAMPVDPTKLRGRYSESLVALAGPLMNVLLAVLSLVGLGLWMRWSPHVDSQAAANARYLLTICGRANIMLAIFNLLPVPPLDGSHVLANLSRWYDRFVAGLTRNAPSAYLWISIVLLLAVSQAIWRVADHATLQIASAAAGHRLTFGST